MPSGDRAARVMAGPRSPWINKHRNVSQEFDQLYSVLNPASPIEDFFGDLRLTVEALQGLIRDAIRDSVRLRALGGGWSLSRAAVTNGRLIDTLGLNWAFPADGASVAAAYRGDPGVLMYLQCGVNVREANEILLSRPTSLALKTSGASNGQSIAGAIATGTHGSRYRFGAMQDYVVGMHLITGPDSSIWLERKSEPVVSGGLIADVGATLVQDDMLFNAALVSFGSFGIVHGLLIEAEPVYLLEVWRRRLPLDARLRRAMQSLDFRDIDTPDPSIEPFHFEVVVNPHDAGAGAYVTTMYQRPYRSDYPRPPISPGGLGPGDDVLGIMGDISDRLPGLAGNLENLIVPAEYPLLDGVLGTPGEIFHSNTDFQKAMSIEIGVGLDDVPQVLDLMLSAPAAGNYAGLLAFRWVKRSRALLAFTRFDTTCTVELPAAYADSTMVYYESVWQALENAGIRYTLHWGQINNLTSDRVRRMYGPAVDDWIASRNAVLEPEVREVFSSPFLEQCGLG